ncbi:MAG TPA: NADH-quinone oxidoreductase subunit N [Ignavibacteriaceae bacterium]|nr:NADH-quinone oxidoreductase subunit N [Ignavibacteriaceae bacterium]
MIYLNEVYNIIPLLIIGGGIIVSILIELYSKSGKSILPWFSFILFLAAGFYSLLTVENQSIVFQNMLSTGGITNIFYFIFNIGAALVCLLSVDYTKKYGINYGEYYILIQNSVLGMMMMAGAKSLFMIFLGLEVMSVCFYVLAGVNRKKDKAIEASLKYFLLGAFATGFLVYGIALIYGSAQTTSIDAITAGFPEYSSNIIFLVGILLFLIGFSFKIAAFPFHMWVPDVYQGAPTTVTGLFSTIGKAAAFAAIIATLTALFSGESTSMFLPYLAVLSIFSMLFGSIVAIAQSNIKRMLAYSSISHAGYILIGLASGTSVGIAGVVFYLAVYTFMNLAAFGIIALIEGENDTNLEINSYSGLSTKSPVLAALLAIIMFSLAGLPPLAGFFAKYYVFVAAIKSGLTWLAILGIISSVISVYFYLRIVVLMYFKEAEAEVVPSKSYSGFFGVAISVIMVILLGIIPGSLLDLITSFL